MEALYSATPIATRIIFNENMAIQIVASACSIYPPDGKAYNLLEKLKKLPLYKATLEICGKAS